MLAVMEMTQIRTFYTRAPMLFVIVVVLLELFEVGAVDTCRRFWKANISPNR